MATKEKDGGQVGKIDIGDEEIHWDTDIDYSQYLQLDRVLSSQLPLTDEHDEILFIVIHQATELWLKLCLHELRGAISCLQRDQLGPAFKMLARVARVQDQLKQSWDVLSTLTPFDYLKFRDRLGRSSGFQSVQYRLLEFTIGNKNADLIKVHEQRPEVHKLLEAALATPSLYDEALMLLARRGLDLPKEATDRNWAEPYAPHPQVEAAWLEIYRDVETHWDLYELAEKLVDLEQQFQAWRFAHVKTVERIIGHKRGTGGSSGVAYLSKALDLRFFPELWSVRTLL
jgi:tryptophan 2,3-dioxygenase